MLKHDSVGEHGTTLSIHKKTKLTAGSFRRGKSPSCFSNVDHPTHTLILVALGWLHHNHHDSFPSLDPKKLYSRHDVKLGGETYPTF